MPLYDCRKRDSAREGSQPFPRFDGRAGHLFDATGARLEYVIWCDTDTGEVERYDRRTGDFRLNADLRVATVREFRPAPLAYLPPKDLPPGVLMGKKSLGGQKWVASIVGEAVYTGTANFSASLTLADTKSPQNDCDPPIIVGGT